MNLKIVLTLVVIGAIALASVMIVVSRNKTTVTPVSESNDLKSDAEISPAPNLKDYIDPSGFSFSYPESLTLIPGDALDSITYNRLILTSKTFKGNIAINVADSKFKNIKDLLTNKKVTASQKNVNLADLEASQYEQNNRLTTLALDDGVLFEVTLDTLSNKNDWISSYNQIIESFAFEKPEPSTPQQQAQPDNGSSDDVVFEGEEVVE